MGLKAKNGKVETVNRRQDDVKPGYGWGDRKPVEFPEKPSEDIHNRNETDDDLVMIMMPKQTYDSFMELAKKHGGSAAQAMSTALKLLEKACEAAEEDGGAE